MARQHDVKAFLQNQRWKRFEWGASDCCLFVADWVREVTGDDPAKDFRGSYSNASGARNALYSGGGYLSILRRSGWKETGRAYPGDIAVLNVSGKRLMALWCEGWFWRAPLSGIAYRRDGEALLVLECPR